MQENCFLGIKTFPFGLQKTSTSIDEEDEVAIKLMHEEDLSFQLLQDADTVHKYAFKKSNEVFFQIVALFDPFTFSNKIGFIFSTGCSIMFSYFRYVASRGQREKEEDIYEVFPPTITVRHRSTRIIRHR